MTKYYSVSVKLSDSQPDKLKSVRKNETGMMLIKYC